MPKIEKEIIVRNLQGLHARPAALFVQTAAKFNSEIMIRKGEEIVNGKSIMGILMLGVQHLAPIVVIANGDDAERAIIELEEFLSKNE